MFLWFVFGDSRLSAYARGLIEDEVNAKFLSVASVWEMAIKHSINRLPLTLPFGDFVLYQLAQSGIQLLPIGFEHLVQVSSLPLHHRDPFDRLIIAQSLVENMAVVSADAAFDAYGVSRLW